MSGLLPETEDAPPPPDGPGLFGDAAPASAPAPTLAPAPPPIPAQAAAYRVLARKYRPTTFDDLIGQAPMVRVLRHAFEQGRIAHAWMLTGVRGVGKTTTARIIARALDCVGPDGRGGPTISPCGVCPHCTAILADRHPDVIEMDAASNTGVDDVRDVIEATRYGPLQARFKVFIIDEVHMLSKNAFNALLKTLEEPPPYVKFIFATTEIRKVPVTVLSRCQRFDLRRIAASELAGLFTRVAQAEGATIVPAALDLIARAADGSARDGLSLLDQAIAQAGPAATVDADQVADMLGLADRTAIHALMEALVIGRPDQVLELTDRAHERGADLGLLLNDLLDLTHTLTRLKAVPALRDGPELPEAERALAISLADRLSMPTLGRLWQLLLKGSGEVEQAPDRRAAAEMVLIRCCYVADLPSPADIVRRLQLPPPGATRYPDSPSPSGEGTRAVANGAPFAPAPDRRPIAQAVAQAIAQAVAQAVDQAVPEPTLVSFRDVARLAETRREALLHANLLHHVHLVRFTQGLIELRPEPDAPRDLAPSLARMLLEATGQRWTIALSRDEGEPTLSQQGAAADLARRRTAADHPLVRAIMDAFPGAAIARVSDARADTYGLLEPTAGPALLEPPPDHPGFAPPDAVLLDEGDVGVPDPD